MKNKNLLTLATLLVSGSIVWAANAPTTAPAASDPGDAILAATDASTAVSAFATALAANKDNPAVYRAFVRKMVDLNQPLMASDQAQALTKLDARSGLGWSVAAYAAAGKDDYRTALAAILRGVEYLPNDPFVIRTAAQVMGWFDARYKYADLPREYRLLISQLTQKYNGQAEFSQAYEIALRDLAPGAAKAATPNVCPPITMTGAAPRSSAYGPAYAPPARATAALPPIAPRPVYSNPVVNSLHMLPPQNQPPPVLNTINTTYSPLVPFRNFPIVTGATRVVVTEVGEGGGRGRD